MNFRVSLTSIIIILIYGLTSCNYHQKTGPCDYNEEKFNMTIIDVLEDTTQENMYIVYVDFDGNIEWANEMHTLAEIREVTTDFDFIINNHIEPGRVYTGTFYQLIEESGNCESYFVDWNQKLIRN